MCHFTRITHALQDILYFWPLLLNSIMKPIFVILKSISLCEQISSKQVVFFLIEKYCFRNYVLMSSFTLITCFVNFKKYLLFFMFSTAFALYCFWVLLKVRKLSYFHYVPNVLGPSFCWLHHFFTIKVNITLCSAIVISIQSCATNGVLINGCPMRLHHGHLVCVITWNSVCTMMKSC
jgi:hypothetical protein